ncbi:adenosine A2a receptor b [Hypomesus transpacificus]|uniref:adenosine A2a receptor b n=1 Tax=Hypomesus transpacificus TaxID=137520 RepID=UPI001F075EFE|nr:adenosine A2a receptor b [Hypomesus transpacificus]
MLTADSLVYMGLEVIIAILAVVGNVLVCWAVCLNSTLQSITNFFVVSLAVADIAVGLLAIPFAIAISTGFCANFHGCLFIACFVLVLTQSSIFSLLAIAVDRYIAIKSPLRYNSLVTGKRAKGIIAVCWILSAGIGLTPMMGWNKGLTTNSSSLCPESLTECLFEGVVTLQYMVYFNFFGCVVAPLAAMLAIYASIFMAARRQLRLMELKAVHGHAPGAGAAPAGSSASRSTLQKEVHAAKSLAIIVGLFAFCWLPVHLVNCFNLLCQECGRLHIWLMNIAILLSHANSVVNPFIYAYRIREFRLTFRRILQQHVLRQRDGHGRAGGRGDGGSTTVRTSSRISMVDGSSVTVVNNYARDPPSTSHTPKHSPPMTQEAHRVGRDVSSTPCPWTPPPHSDPAPISVISNGHHKLENSISELGPTGILGHVVQGGTEAAHCGGTTTLLMEVKDGGHIFFVNPRPLSLTQTSPTRSVELTEVA